MPKPYILYRKVEEMDTFKSITLEKIITFPVKTRQFIQVINFPSSSSFSFSISLVDCHEVPHKFEHKPLIIVN